MEIDIVLVDHLEANVAVAALLGGRIYPVVLPQRVAYPATRVQRISTARELAHDGPLTLARPRIQIDTWSPNYQEAKDVAKAIRIALNGFKGIMDGISVGAIQFVDEREDWEEQAGPSGQEAGLYRVRQDLFVWHQEAIA